MPKSEQQQKYSRTQETDSCCVQMYALRLHLQKKKRKFVLHGILTLHWVKKNVFISNNAWALNIEDETLKSINNGVGIRIKCSQCTCNFLNFYLIYPFWEPNINLKLFIFYIPPAPWSYKILHSISI